MLRKEEKCKENKTNFEGAYLSGEQLGRFSSNLKLKVPHPEEIRTENFVFLFGECQATDA